MGEEPKPRKRPGELTKEEAVAAGAGGGVGGILGMAIGMSEAARAKAAESDPRALTKKRRPRFENVPATE